jgi:hypothetical protein
MSMASIRRQYRRDMTSVELRQAIAMAAVMASSRDRKSAIAGKCRLHVLREIAAAREEVS